MNDFVAINALYEATFGDHKPARSCVEVSRLPKDVLVEIECIARSAQITTIGGPTLTIVSSLK